MCFGTLCSEFTINSQQEPGGSAGSFPLQSFTPHQLCSLCSYDGDVDIDAVVKEPITAGVKGLQVGISFFRILCITLIIVITVCVY